VEVTPNLDQSVAFCLLAHVGSEERRGHKS
jgi:hypothetical protein